MKMRIQQGFIPIIGLVIILVVAIIAAGSIYYVARQEKSVNANVATINASANVNRNTNVNGNLNSNVNTNTTRNLNSNSNTNANSAANTNSTVNLNATTNTNTSTGTTGWKTYTDSEYGFSFQYPAELTASNNAKRQYQTHAYSLASVGVSGIPKKTDRSVSVSYYDYALEPENLRGLYGQITSADVTPITVDGQTGYLYSESNGGTRFLHIQVAAKDGNILVFEFAGGEYGDYNPWYTDAAERAMFVSTINMF